LEKIEMSILGARLAKPVAQIGKLLPVAALALGFGLMTPTQAFAQHSGGGHGGGGSHAGGGGHGGGGGGHGGGGHGGGGGFHGGGGGHGGGWHGDGGHGWHDHDEGWGGGWGGGFYGGFYPGFGFYPGYYDGGYDPFWAYGSSAYDDQLAYAPPVYPAGPQQYGPQSQYYQDGGPGGLPTDNSRGFYTWQLGVEGGTCNRPYLQQIASSVTGTVPGSLQVGAQLGGIPVQPVIGGRIGPRLDITDQACATEVLEHARIGVPVRWETSSGIPVSLQVTRTTDGQGGQCRDYEATAQFGSHTDTVGGSACKGPDGSWRATR
jgi:surface antigen